MNIKKLPRATYRLQLNANFNFSDVMKIVDYLRDLGISHLYLSPCLQATKGSTHGYDVVNHGCLNAELGNKADFALLCNRLKNENMGIILDIVPNHMAISGPENPWWWDVLENGSESQFSRYFDVDWHSDSEDRSNLILLPILGNHYGLVLENKELILKHSDGTFTINYYEKVFPVAPRSLPIILELAYQRSNTKELGFLANAFGNLPHASSRDIEKIQQRQRDKSVLEEILRALCRNPKVVRFIDEAVEQINGDVDLLDRLIGRQNYKLAFWKLSKYQVGYRRFFNINSLVGLRMEDPQVFEDSHRLVIEMANKGLLDGFRIDHPDGLYDPTTYFHRLNKACPDSIILAEKILDKNESLPEEWPISGTTGYDFLNMANGLFIEPEGRMKLERIWRNFTGEEREYETIVYQTKKKILRDLLGSELNRLSCDLAMICENHRRYRDFATRQLADALTEVAAGMTIYRTYIQPETGVISDEAKSIVVNAVNFARKQDTELDSYIFDFIEDILTLKLRGNLENEFIMRFQQLTGPVMAKSLEDTVFYIYNPLTSANEVGGDPSHPEVSKNRFYEWCCMISAKWPLTMLASSTHDSKRSEDVRARINVLSEIPDEWQKTLTCWQQLNAKYKTDNRPDANTEYLFYQTLVGCWPISVERVSKYMEKAVREAKVYSNWFRPNLEFENCLKNFISKAMANTDFIKSLNDFLKKITAQGSYNSLAQLALKLTAPGIPDIYQGNEIWNNSLTDPDNRRPVDFEKITGYFASLSNMKYDEVIHKCKEGQAKQYLIKTILNLRRNLYIFNEPDSFKPVEVLGLYADNVVAFMRGTEVMVVVPRLTLKIRKKWGSTRIILPEGNWRDIFTGQIHKAGSNKLKDLVKHFPVSILVKENQGLRQ
ncbi:MAG: malto-oligosyltrehalose synthase [Candidatus Rifleibacteriota bacterium]